MPSAPHHCGRLYAWLAALAAVCSATTAQALTPGSLSEAISATTASTWSEPPGFGAVPSNYQSYDDSAVIAPEPMPGDSAVGAPCASCNGGAYGGYFYNRCGCNSQQFPWIRGVGNCDQWCVGPHWEVAVDGLVLFREDGDFNAIAADAGLTPSLVEQFDEAPGVRLFVTAYNDADFGMQVGYEGVNDYHATALLPQAGATRILSGESRINSLEINFVRRTDMPWHPFGGVRYIQLEEDFLDFVAIDVPAPATPPSGPTTFVDNGSWFFLTNRLIGFQAGAFRDMWRVGRRLTIEPYGNAGVYFNDFKRENFERTAVTIVTGDDPTTPGNEFTQVTSEIDRRFKNEISEMAFVGEAGVTGVWRIHRCVALRGGYQVLALNGVGQAADAFFAPGLPDSTLVYHGFHFGVEYVR